MSKTKQKNSTEPPSVRKRAAFYAILVLMPVLALLLLEGLLRAVSFGKTIPLFVEGGAPAGYLQPNPDIIQRYFPKSEMAPKVSPDTVFFTREKSPDAYRIVIQGGSTAAGFPYGRWGSLQGMLDQRFKRLFPDTEIEVINTAMAAVNSYTLLDFVDEIIAREPDLVVIYAGHNEYLGVMGAGSIFAGKGGRAATLMYLKLKNLRIYQAMERIFYAVMIGDTAGDDDHSDGGRSLMSRVAKGKEIPMGSQIYDSGLAQFEGNLDLILAKYNAAGIPVVLGSLVSNEKDQVPFSSVAHTDWEAFSPDDLSQAERERLSDLDSQDAADWFKRGDLLVSKENTDGARGAYQRARDLDMLRFRAPSQFNDIIQSKIDPPKVFLASVESKIRQDSELGIVGKAHMLEHLHPNARGYFLLAEAFVDSILANANAISLPSPRKPVSTEHAWKDIPITRVAERVGDYKILKLTNDFPFKRERREVPLLEASGVDGSFVLRRAKGEDWIPVQRQLLQTYIRAKDYTEAARVAGNLSDAFIGNAKMAKLAGDLYRDQNDARLAIFYYHRAVKYEPDNVSRRLSLAQAYFLDNDVRSSLKQLDRVLVQDPSNQNAMRYKAKLLGVKAGGGK